MDYLQYTPSSEVSFKRSGNVLNLIINGLPSILMETIVKSRATELGFKPYYKWITFNT